MLSLWIKTYKGFIGNWHIFLVLLWVLPRLYNQHIAVATAQQPVSAQGKARRPGRTCGLPLVETDRVAPCVAWHWEWLSLRKQAGEEVRRNAFWHVCYPGIPLTVLTSCLHALSPLTHRVVAPTPRSQLSFFSLRWVRPGRLGDGPHDGAWDGRPPPRCWLSSWRAARSGACPGPHGWAAPGRQQSAGLVWYWPVNHPLGKKLNKPVWVKYFYSAYRTSERLGW